MLFRSISIIQEENKFRMWYEAFPDYDKDKSSFLCYAESRDGYNWEKPDLELVEWDGNTRNNILFKPEMHPTGHGLHGPCVFLDKNPECPASEKYKLAHSGPDRGDGRQCYGAVSPDGIIWNFIEEPIVKEPIWADTQTVIEWNSDKEKYVGFFRGWWYNRRHVYFGQTDDFYNWTGLKPVLTSDPTLPPDHDWYCNGFHTWPGARNAYLLMPTIYRRSRDDLCVELRTSRDFRNWYKLKTNPIIEPDEHPDIFYGGVYLGHGILQFEDKTWAIPVGAPNVHHNEQRVPGSRTGHIYLAKWREDGFLGLYTKDKGEFWSQIFSFEGDAIQLSANVRPGGIISIGLHENFSNGYLPGFEIENCKPIDVNCFWDPVSWKDNPELAEFDDCRIRVHVKLERATLYGLRFI